MGVTCVGKSTFMQRSVDIMGNKIGLVEVGKEMRKRYPPERFRGQAAMADTEDEIFEIYTKQLKSQLDKEIILVDGQPRFESQVPRIWNQHPEISKSCLWLHISDCVIQGRIRERFSIEDPTDCFEKGTQAAKRDLAQQRVTNDKIQLFPVLWLLISRGVKITPLEHLSDFNHRLFWKGY